MLIYDQAYMQLRNKYLVPLSKYAIQYKSLRNTNIKRIMARFTSVDANDDKSYTYSFNTDDLMKALLGDIFLFFIRAMIHKYDLQNIMKSPHSANWNIVTNYYYSFFLGGLLLRLCHRGNIFLDIRIRKQMEELMEYVLHDEKIILESNLFYEVQYDNTEYVLKLTKGEANTHEIVWKKVYSLFEELYSFAKSGTDEHDVLKNILQINKDFSNTFPSQLRNRVNYQLIYGINWVDNKLYAIDNNVNWIQEIMFYKKNNLTDDNKIARLMYSYTKYIEYLCNNLIGEYYEMQGKQNGIITNLNKKLGSSFQHPESKYKFSLNP